MVPKRRCVGVGMCTLIYIDHHLRFFIFLLLLYNFHFLYNSVSLTGILLKDSVLWFYFGPWTGRNNLKIFAPKKSSRRLLWSLMRQVSVFFWTIYIYIYIPLGSTWWVIASDTKCCLVCHQVQDLLYMDVEDANATEFQELGCYKIISYKTFDRYFCTDRMSLQHNP